MSASPPETFVDLLSVIRGHAARRPEAPAIAWFDRQCAVSVAHDNAGFLARCEGLAGALLAEGCRPGQPVLLLHPPGIAFFESFVACLIAGLLPVPAYPPDPLGRGPRLDFVTGVCARMGIEVGLTTARYDRARRLGNVRHVLSRAGGWPAVRWIATDRLAPGAAPAPRRPAPDDVAFVQFTSGSTLRPRGVRITHRNLMHQLRVNTEMGAITPASRLVSWLPQYHDFGLVNAFLCALYVGCPLWLCSPLDFIGEPSIWPEMMHRVRATHTGSPDFGYVYTVRRTTPAQRSRWDLSALTCAASGGEAVRPATVRAFAEAFAPSGLRRDALYGGFGQAEHVVGMAGGRVRIVTVDGSALRCEGALVPVPAEHPRARELASSGTPFDGVEVRIVDPQTRAVLPPDRIGEIWVHSPSVSPGYVDEPARTAAVFDNRLEGDPRRWLRTGDLGALSGRDLFVTGRMKDLIVVRGRNVIPADVEDRIRAARLPEVRPGSVVVFGLEEGGEETVAAVVEVRDKRLDRPRLAALAERIKAVVAADGLHLARLQLARKGTVPKTTSGKLQRGRCAAALAAGRPVGDRPPLFEMRWALPDPTPDADGALVAALEAARARPTAERAPAIRAALIDWLAAGTDGPVPDRGDALDDSPLTDLGLDSLRAATVFAAAERALGVTTSRLTAYALTTFGELVEWIADPPADAAVAPLSTRAPEHPVPATAFQRVIHRDHGSAPGVVAVFEVGGPLTAPMVRRALAAVLRRHDLLRAAFEEVAGRLMIVPRPAPTDPEAIPLLALADDGPAEALIAALRRPFDVAREPLLRVAFVPGEPARLGLAIHHLIYDGISLHALLAELFEALARCAGGHAPSAEPAASFLALAAERGEPAADASSWWREALADVPWPVPVPRDVEPSSRALVRAGDFALEPTEVAALSALARRHGASLNVVVALAWAHGMGAALGVGTVVCGHPISLRDGRTRAVCGPLVNDVLLPLPAHTATPLALQLRAVGQRLRDAIRHGDVPLQDQLALLSAPGSPVESCPVLYAFQDWDSMAARPVARALRGVEPWTVGPLNLRRLPGDAIGGPRPFDYFAVAELADGRLTCGLRVEQARVGADCGAAVVDGWRRVLRAMAADGAHEEGAP